MAAGRARPAESVRQCLTARPATRQRLHNREPIRLADQGCEMRLPTRNPEKRPAVAAVEAALVLPLLFILLFGVWETSRMIQVAQAVSNAAREGARQASAGQPASNVGVPAGM